MPVTHPMQRIQGGFTATELLIAFASILALVLLATTVWQTQTVRRHVDTAWREAQPVLNAAEAAFERLEEPPIDRRDVALPPDPTASSGRYVESVDVAYGRVDIRFGHRAHAGISGRVLRLVPYRNAAGEVEWRCRAPDATENLSALITAGEPAHLREPIAPLAPRHHPWPCR